MKWIIYIAGVVWALASCGNATDGDPTTDTTTMPVDTAVQSNMGADTATTINTNTGSQSTTETFGMRKPDTNASTATDPKTRQNTSGAHRSKDSVVHNKQ